MEKDRLWDSAAKRVLRGCVVSCEVYLRKKEHALYNGFNDLFTSPHISLNIRNCSDSPIQNIKGRGQNDLFQILQSLTKACTNTHTRARSLGQKHARTPHNLNMHTPVQHTPSPFSSFWKMITMRLLNPPTFTHTQTKGEVWFGCWKRQPGSQNMSATLLSLLPI